MSSSKAQDHPSPLSARWMLVAILAVTAGVVLAWGHFKLLDQDEIFVLQTDSVPSVRALIDVQRHYPISLDPMVYHLLGHASVKVFGANAFAVRLPSLVGYLLMQVCLFLAGRRLASERAGLLAAAVTALTATVFYGVEARPYGVLLGLSALLLLSWIRAADGTARRAGSLALLAISLGLALNTHYFAVLLLIPLCGAELVRIVKLRRVDWPMLLAIAGGLGCIAFTLPFQHAAGEFRLHYYNAGRVGLHAITQSYRALFINYTDYSMRVQHAVMALLVLAALWLLASLWAARERWPAVMHRGAGAYLLLLAALPFAGFLLARFVTHSIEVRYVLPAMIGLSLLIAIAARPERWSQAGFRNALISLLILVAVAGAVRAREERGRRDARLASLAIPAELQRQLMANPDSRLYVQNLGDFEEDVPYVADKALQDRMTLLYSAGEEIHWLGHDTAALTAMHLQRFTRVPVVRYDDVKRQPGRHIFLLKHAGGWNWIESALAQDGASITRLGPALDGTAAAAEFKVDKP